MADHFKSIAPFCYLQAFPRELTDDIRDRLKQDGTPPAKNLFDKFKVFLVAQLNVKYWREFTQR